MKRAGRCSRVAVRTPRIVATGRCPLYPCAVPLEEPDPDQWFPVPTASGLLEVHLRTATMSDFALWKRGWEPVLKAHKDGSADWDWLSEIRLAALPGRTCWSITHGAAPSTKAVDRLKGWFRRNILRRPGPVLVLDGLISLSVSDDETSRFTPGAPLVYVAWVGSAPHNRRAYGVPLIRNVTEILFGAAVAMSRD